MRTLTQLAGFTALALAASVAQAAEFGPLMDVVHATWPGKDHIAVVANYSSSQDAILDLARQAGSGATITVLDIHSRTHLERAAHLIMNQVKPDYLVLLPGDPLAGEGSFHATRLVGQIASAGIPAVGTSPRAIAQGAVFAMGPETGMDVLVTHRLIGTVEVILPARGRYLTPVASLHGMAAIDVVSGF